MDREAIEGKVRELHLQIWKERAVLWPDREAHPLDVIDPAVAANVLRIDLQYHQELSFGLIGSKYETAGLLDRNLGVIAIATKFGPQVSRFTTAHELGHWVLHPKNVIQHRDRPIHGHETGPKDPIEREADCFAARYLMPAKLVRNVFQSIFLRIPFVFDDTTSFFLRPDDTNSLLRPERDSNDREYALATAHSFNGKRFNSLSEIFKVSPKAMAIRIQELELIRSWP